MKRYLFFILSAIVLVSCAREWEPEEALPEEGLVERTWTVTMSDGTRATLDESLRPVWEAGEELSVYDHVAGVGRIFTVQSVDGYRAPITGMISDGGDTPFDAIYPAKSAGEWVSDGTGVNCPLKLPEIQLIPEGRNVCPDVLVSTAHSDLPEGVIAFRNISSLLKVIVDREGISDGFGQEYRRSSATPLEAHFSGILSLGKVSVWDPWRYYRIDGKKTKTYDKPLTLLNDTGLLGNVSSFLLNMMIAIYLPNSDYNVEAITYNYLSADPQGKPVELSALLYIPQRALESNESLTGVAIANHGTMNRTQAEGAFAWKNFAIVMPDYYGFGASEDRPQAFLDPETTARGNIDAYLAAVQLMKDHEVTIPDKFYNAGYSQGGFNAMANLKYVAQHPELEITFEKTMCGGSPFDIALTWRKYLQEEFGRAIGFVPLTVVSMNESQKLGLSYSDLFKGELLTNWRDWILSKEYNIATINSKIGTTSLSDVMTEDFMAGTGNAYDTIMSTCVRFSLTSGWIPPKDTVPYENLAAMMSFLESSHQGKHSSSGGDNDGGHVDAIVPFITTILSKW